MTTGHLMWSPLGVTSGLMLGGLPRWGLSDHQGQLGLTSGSQIGGPSHVVSDPMGTYTPWGMSLFRVTLVESITLFIFLQASL